MLRAGFTAAALAVTMAAATPALAGKADDTLKAAFAKELETLDTYFAASREGVIMQEAVWDALVYRNPLTNEYEPNLATAWTWVDPVTLDLTLREGVRFHNGEPFDADDVVFTVNWVADPANGVESQRKVNWMKSAEKLGDHAVRIHLHAPFPAAMEYLSGPVAMYPDEYYGEVGPKGMGLQPVGTGPYKVTEVEPGKRFVLERYEGYHADSPKGVPGIGRVEIRVVPDVNTQMAELMSGGLDWTWQVPSDQAERLADVDGLTVVNAATMRIGMLILDAAGRSGETPLTDLRVRRALNHAIDRGGIVSQLVKGESAVVHSACYPSQFGCTEDVARYDYDPARAKALLAEAGYPDGFTIDFYAYRDRPVSEVILANLAAIGVKANLVQLTYPALRDKSGAGGTPVSFHTWGSYSVNDVSAITSHYFKFDTLDYARDEQVRDWLEEGDTSIDPQVRRDAYANALKRIADQAYWVPLHSYTSHYAFTEELVFRPTADEIPRFHTMSWR